MIEGAIQGVGNVEGSKNSRVNKVIGNIERTGRQFLSKKLSFVNHYEDWRVVRDAADISFSKKGDKQHLKIHYEKPQENIKTERRMDGFDFTLSDGKTKISLKKAENGSWKITREKDGHQVEGGNILRKDEERELSNFLYKFKRDRILNNIIKGAKKASKDVEKVLDKVDPDKIYRYVVPTAVAVVGIATGGFHINTNQISADSWQAAFFGPPAASRQIGAMEKNMPRNIQKTAAQEEETTQNVIHFQNEYTQIFETERNAVLNGEESNVPGIDILGPMQELELVSNFYPSSHAKKDGQSLELEIRKYLRSLYENGIYNYRQYDSVGKPGKALVGNLEQALIDIRNNPYSQRSVFGLLDALHRFNTGKSMVTPEQIMLQTGFQGSTESFSAQDIWNAYWSNPEIFDVGTIKATSIIYDTTSIGDMVVSQDLIGRVVNINGNKMTVWVYDQSSGKVSLKTFTSENFPNPALGFR
jgi:hypothetical protein